MRPESLARERAFLLAYASDMEGSLSGELISELQKETTEEVLLFSETLYSGMKANQKEIDEIIQRYLKNWTLERLRAVDRSILRIAIYELIFYKKTPEKVVFDEYIELAKRYGDTDSSSFINGVLDSVYKSGK